MTGSLQTIPKESFQSTWATQLDVVENQKHNGIELRFNAMPSPLLQAKLRVNGYRPSKSQNMWYAEKAAHLQEFATAVKVLLAHSPDGPPINLSPSFEPSKTAIEKKDFSYVIISLKNGDTKNFVIFEPSKPKAEILATTFAKEQFKDLFADLIVKPRTNVREARILYNEQKVIAAVPSPTIVSEEQISKTQTVTAQQPEKKLPEPKRKKKEGRSLNQLAMNQSLEALIDSLDRDKAPYSEEDKNILRRYTGSGGLIKQGASGRGILYEYYTADAIIKKMWDLAYHYGYNGGSVLEPAVGTGNFLKYVPKETEAVGFETNHYAARIAQVLYPQATIYEKEFESNFFAGNVHLKNEFSEKRYGLVIGNPPYGEFSGRYAGMGEKKFTSASQYEQYFTLRGLDLLEVGGLLVYILPSNFLKNPSDKNIANKIAERCTGLDRYRLGEGAFKTTSIETDILVLRRK
jgi:type I restriction-modification system DNA methylase subunit